MILRQNSAQVSELEVCAYLRDSEMLMYPVCTAASFFPDSSSLITFCNGLTTRHGWQDFGTQPQTTHENTGSKEIGEQPVAAIGDARQPAALFGLSIYPFRTCSEFVIYSTI